jgi:hypothetical protein
MNKLQVQKIQKSIFWLFVIFVSFACRIPDAVQVIMDSATQKCETVSREIYEISARQIGQTPETPDDPESAVYEVCYSINNPNPISVRMYGGNKLEDEDNEQIDNGEPNPNPSASDADENITITGTYVGTSNYPEVLRNMGWFKEDEGDLTYHNVTVNVADDGNVSGTYSLYFVGYQQDNFEYFGEICSGHAEADITGVFEGQLTGSQGTIRSTENWVCPQFYDCQILDVCTTDEPYYREFTIQINNGSMTGITVPWPEDTDGIFVWTFTAIKQ